MRTVARALMLLGWAVLLAGPVAGWYSVRPVDPAAVAYGSTPPSHALGALRVAAPGALVAMILLLVGAGRARGVAARTGVPPGGVDRVLVAASRAVGLAIAACAALLVPVAMFVGGPPGMIGGFAIALVTFSLIGRRLGRPRDPGPPAG